MLDIRLVLASAAGVLLLLLWLRFRFSAFYRHASQWPGYRSLPLVGNIFLLGFTEEVQFTNMVKAWRKFGTFLGFWAGPMFIAVPSDPRDLEVILSKHAEKRFPFTLLARAGGSGLVTIASEKWHRRRKVINPAFSYKVLGNFVPVFNSKADELVQKLNAVVGEGPVDIMPLIKNFALDAVWEAAFGVRVDQVEDDKIISTSVRAMKEQGQIIMYRIMRPWCYIDFVWERTAMGKRETANIKAAQEVIQNVVSERKQYIAEQTSKTLEYESDGHHKTFLDLLILIAQGADELSDEDIRDEVMTFVISGQETISSAVSFLLYEMSLHQDIQEKIVEEIEREIGDVQDVSHEKLNRLQYSERVVKESLRVHPPAPNYTRYLPKDVRMVTRDLTIPGGSTVVISPYFVHHNPDAYPDPEKFDPDRFLPENSVGRHPYAFVPFSNGIRNCIGYKYAMLELKMALVKVIYHYKILPAPNFHPHLTAGLVLESSTGIKVMISPRKFQ